MSEIHTDVFHPTRAVFIAIFDSEGDIQEVYPDRTVLDDVFRECERLDKCGSDYAPHTAWEYHEGDWHQLKERIGMEILRFRTPRSIKIAKKPTE